MGQAWVDKNTFRVRRVEGDMAKTPSWMLKKVHVRLDFADISGTWIKPEWKLWPTFVSWAAKLFNQKPWNTELPVGLQHRLPHCARRGFGDRFPPNYCSSPAAYDVESARLPPTSPFEVLTGAGNHFTHELNGPSHLRRN